VLGEPRLHVGQCESTQLLLLGSGLPEGALATADHQTGGRGRLGRPWVEAPGTAVLCSVLLRPPPGRPAQELSLVAGIAVAEAVESISGVQTQIKWPNDVLVGGRKLVGVLPEQRGDEVVVGIGINVNQTAAELPADTRRPATSLRLETGREHDRELVLSTVLARLDDLYTRWRTEGLAAVRDGLVQRDFLRGRRVRVDGLEGLAEGIDEAGRLVVSGRAVGSGEIRLLADGE